MPPQKSIGVVAMMVLRLFLVVPLVAALLCAGCELSGHYHDDNVDVQFGDTNSAAHAEAQ